MKVNNKRIITFLISLMFVLVVTNVIKQNRVLALTSDEFSYRIEDDDTATITGYSGYSYNIYIPGMIDGHMVRNIGYMAFAYNKVYSISIPNGVTKISGAAFEGCRNLTNIKIPDSVTEIENGAFMNCESLNDVVIPGSISALKQDVFYGCSNLNNIVISEGVESIGFETFGKSGLTNITIPKSVMSIDQYAFDDSSNLCELHFNGDAPTVIGSGLYEIPSNVIAYVFDGSLGFPDNNEKWYGITINKIYTVKFNSNGGTSIASEKVAYNNSATEPTSPKKAGYTFGGWYRESTFAIRWNFYLAVTKNTTLYAKWIPNKYTVKFNSNGGTSITSKTANYNNLITVPVNPTKVGYTFLGWYKESTFITKWNFSADKVNKNTTLYAKWVQNPAVPSAISISKLASTSAKVSWSSISGASGYEIYMATSSTGSYTLLTSTTCTSYTKTSLVKGKTYYLKVRAYKIINNQKVYGGYTKIVSVKI